jgi:CubicO group peptidase (beta-lactamase class C family)
VLQQATGKWLDEFAKEVLFEPLGITKFEWVRLPASREPAAGSGLRLRPRDLAKIGQLVIDKGVWKGQRIVSEKWIEESTLTRQEGLFGISSLGYGYQWWTDYKADSGRQIAWTCAQGFGGQRIYTVPAFDLVVVITAGLYDDKSQDWVPFEIFEKYVLAAVRAK